MFKIIDVDTYSIEDIKEACNYDFLCSCQNHCFNVLNFFSKICLSHFLLLSVIIKNFENYKLELKEPIH